MKLCDFEVGLDRPLFLMAGPCVIESAMTDTSASRRGSIPTSRTPALALGEDEYLALYAEVLHRPPGACRPDSATGAASAGL